MTYTEANKRAIKKYVDANREKVTNYINTWRRENKESVRENRKKIYNLKRDSDYEVIAKVFRKILR